MLDFNMFNLDFANLAKLMKNGRVDKVYYKMYRVADNLMREDFQRFQLGLLKDYNMGTTELLDKLTDFFNGRIEYHMNEMKELLEMSMKNQR